MDFDGVILKLQVGNKQIAIQNVVDSTGLLVHDPLKFADQCFYMHYPRFLVSTRLFFLILVLIGGNVSCRGARRVCV